MRRMQQNPTIGLPFLKMHGLGNDFVVIDARAVPVSLSATLVTALADRHRGVGFDQLAVITPGDDLTLTFYNADGSLSAACGNATRCIAAREMGIRDTNALSIDITGRGTLQATRNSTGLTSVNMGHPVLDWQDIPLAQEVDTLALPIDGTPVATGMGNPHCTFFVDAVGDIDLLTRGPEIEHHPIFPQRTNVQFAQVEGVNTLRMRVWERGTGVTLASGSSSCAVAVAAVRRGLSERKVTIHLDGGTLYIDWREDGVWMSGPTAHVFDGTLTQSFLDSL
ncbi:diaminopimelate epimerase [uncultured Tateyamaria sp.]|uniref:diaminopimelate epimerase n=1 Tax=uncultured Tateyamaria sp. TaxID=455651 RepID=UPI00261C5B29|nr:diaminopimelate epimerase [uncultured Tateyamaria sp.]